MAETPLECVTNRVFTLIRISVAWKLGAVRVRICLVTPYIYAILRVVALAALVTQNHGGLRVHRNTVVPSNGVNNLYCCVVIT